MMIFQNANYIKTIVWVAIISISIVLWTIIYNTLLTF